jgi:hypothetical protein
MNSRLAALVKHVAELHEAKHKACHCIEEFHLQRIRPLSRECLQKANPNCEPTDGKLSILSLKYWGYYYPDLTLLLSCVVLSQEEIDWLVGQLFDKDPPTTRPAGLPLPYCSETPLLRYGQLFF